MTSLETSAATPGKNVSPEDTGKEKDYKFLEDCYAMALRSTADYALDFDSPATLEFQRHIRELQERVALDSSPDALRSLQASFRGELREYRDKGRMCLQRLRDDLDGAVEAMQTFAGSLVANGEDVQKRVRGEMISLEKAADAGDLEKIRQSVRTASKEVARSYEDLNKANALVIAELQHEIRLLHREIETERRAAWTDEASGAWIKKKIDTRMDELLNTPEAFCVIVILVTNLKRLERQCSKNVVDTGLRALVKRFYGILGEESMIARLSGDQFGAIVEMDSPAAQILAREVGDRLSSRYSVQDGGIAQNIELRVHCGIVARPRETDGAEFRRKFQQMTGLQETAEASTP